MWNCTGNKCCKSCHNASLMRRQQLTTTGVDKENISLDENNELSLYNSNPSVVHHCSADTSPSHCCHYHGYDNGELHQRRFNRSNIRPLDDYDQNSGDTLFTGNYFNDTNSLPSSFSTDSVSNYSMEDDFFYEFGELAEPLETSNLPQDFSRLLQGSFSFCSNNTTITPTCSVSCKRKAKNEILEQQQQNRSQSVPSMRSSFNRSSVDDGLPVLGSRVRSCLFKSTTDIDCVYWSHIEFTGGRPWNKRPSDAVRCCNAEETDAGQSIRANHSKKVKFHHYTAAGAAENNSLDGKSSKSEVVVETSKPVLRRAMSATDESIMCALQRSTTVPDLIGDFTTTYCLPLIQGRQRDLKSISPQTVAELVRDVYKSHVARYQVIDCRYPYEYNGGHILGAINVYTKEQCTELLHRKKAIISNHELPSSTRSIMVFHCEFSSERGPTLCRYLREQDRQLNQDHYPALHYPEIYLMDGGYKSFFEKFPLLCVPIAYKEMLHPEHERELRYFRQKSKSESVDNRQRVNHFNYHI